MQEQKVIIEITDTEIRLVIGYVENGKTHLSHVSTRPILGLISHGEIKDPDTLTQILSSLREIKDPNSKEKFVINDVTVLLPALGLNVFVSEKTSNVVSNDAIIQPIDIENVVSLVHKEKIPENSEIIDIIPDAFILDGSRIFSNPPLGEKSNSITLKAKIHTLPSRIVEDYKRVIENAHMSVNRFCLSSYAASELGRYTEGIPENYILVNMGAEICDITLVGGHSPFGTIDFEAGGTHIVNALREKYGITPDEGLKLLTKYGYCNRELTYTPSISNYMKDGEIVGFTQQNLNEVILDYFKNEFFPRFDVAFETLLKEYDERIRQLPLVFTGGFSMMIGFKEIAEEKFQNNGQLLFLSPNTIGARTPQYSISVGGLLIASANKGSLSEQRHKR